ncbi:MAG TPA: hypothetical protein VG734_19600 [Lacunisphaera sp.]|nr:hypothetical protein [Lacunisphaera sp.]
MKPLLPSLLLTGLLVAGWVIGSRPPVVAPAVPVPSAAAAPGRPLPVTAGPPANPTVSAQAAPRATTEVELARALRSGVESDRNRAFHVLLPALVARDPAMAGHLALAWEPGALRDELLRQFIRQWAAADIGGVITWITSLLDESDRRNASLAATAQVAEDDVAGAVELAQLLHVGLDDGSLERRVQIWTEEKPGEALAWIARRPADAVRDRLLARIAWTRAQREPAEAAGLVLSYMSPGEARDDALLAVVRQWAVRDPAPATDWVAQFPAGALHARALAELATAAKLR